MDGIFGNMTSKDSVKDSVAVVYIIVISLFSGKNKMCRIECATFLLLNSFILLSEAIMLILTQINVGSVLI